MTGVSWDFFSANEQQPVAPTILADVTGTPIGLTVLGKLVVFGQHRYFLLTLLGIEGGGDGVRFLKAWQQFLNAKVERKEIIVVTRDTWDLFYDFVK